MEQGTNLKNDIGPSDAESIQHGADQDISGEEKEREFPRYELEPRQIKSDNKEDRDPQKGGIM